MPVVKSHNRSTTKVSAHYRIPPWVNTFLFVVAVLFVAAKIGGA